MVPLTGWIKRLRKLDGSMRVVGFLQKQRKYQHVRDYIHGPRPHEFIGSRATIVSQTPVGVRPHWVYGLGDMVAKRIVFRVSARQPACTTIIDPRRDRRVRNNRRARPCKFIGFGAIDVTKPHKFIWFGDIYGRKPHNS